MRINLAMICLVGPALTILAGCGGPSKKTPAEAPSSPPQVEDAGPAAEPEPHTEVIAFILSRCPYAAESMRALLALKREMGSALGLSVGYVGLVDGEGNIDPSVGAPEIAASRLNICVGVTADDVEWLDYLECIYEGERWRTLPDGFEECATRAGVDRDQVLDCIESGDGDAILAQAYGAATGSRISSSPTLIIDGHLYGAGKSVAELKQYICYVAGSEETRPAACADTAPPPQIATTLIYDERCDIPQMCDVDAEMTVLQSLVPGLTLTRLAFGTEAGRRLYDTLQKTDLDVRELPVVIIDKAIDGQVWVKDLFGESLLAFGEGYVLALGRGWDPMAEICDNGVDDNGDGAMDCGDPACEETLLCREEKPGQLDMFIMSGCPFATEMIPDVDRLLGHFKRDREAVDFRLQFIGEIEGDELTSMHGPDEVAEDLRMICAQALYGKGYKFMAYVLCRAENVSSPAWEACVPKGMSAKKLGKCAAGPEGKRLLRSSFELSDQIGVTGSPTLILNNKSVLDGRTLSEMVTGFCEKNDSPRCKAPVEEVEETETSEDLQCR